VSRYVDEHRGRFGVEPICKTLGVSVSAYYQRRGGRRSARAVEDEWLLGRIRELHAANYYAYGYRRMWKALRRAGEQVPRCRVQRLMKSNGIVGAKRRGKPWRTTRPGVSETLCMRVSFVVLVGLGSGRGRPRGTRTSRPWGVSSCSRGF
jgi:putative transposase